MTESIITITGFERARNVKNVGLTERVQFLDEALRLPCANTIGKSMNSSHLRVNNRIGVFGFV